MTFVEAEWWRPQSGDELEHDAAIDAWFAEWAERSTIARRIAMTSRQAVD
jgi:hypothetical protein